MRKLSVIVAQRKYDQAADLCQRIQKLCEKLLDAGHIDALANNNNLGHVLGAQGRHEAAEAVLLPTLELVQKQFSKDHHFVQTCVQNLVSALEKQGKVTEAEGLRKSFLVG